MYSFKVVLQGLWKMAFIHYGPHQYWLFFSLLFLFSWGKHFQLFVDISYLHSLFTFMVLNDMLILFLEFSVWDTYGVPAMEDEDLALWKSHHTCMSFPSACLLNQLHYLYNQIIIQCLCTCSSGGCSQLLPRFYKCLQLFSYPLLSIQTVNHSQDSEHPVVSSLPFFLSFVSVLLSFPFLFSLKTTFLQPLILF